MKTKVILTGIVTAALTFTFSLETMSIFAAAPAGGRNFIDSNNDGICDNYGMYCQFIDEDGDGICDYYNNWGACGKGLGYVDEDGDGICDNCNMYCQFIDEDGDGICDYYNNWGACGKGLGYVDENGDGLCDNFISGGRGCNRRGRGGNGNRWYNRR